MKYLEFTVFAFVFLACLVDFGQSIKCYQCNSYMEQQCADDFSKEDKYLMDCPTNVTMCRKIVQEVFYEKDWNVRYVRECAASGEAKDDCRERTGTYKVRVKYCQCNGPACNGSDNIKMSVMAVLLPLFVVVMTAFKKL